MKRDMELIRTILLKVELEYDPKDRAISNLQIPGYDKYTVDSHLKLLEQSGFFDKIVWVKSVRASDSAITISNLTNIGYDYLDKIRDDGTWQKTVKTITDKGLDMSIKTISAVATAFITSATEGAVNAIIKTGGNI